MANIPESNEFLAINALINPIGEIFLNLIKKKTKLRAVWMEYPKIKFLIE